MNLTYSPVCSDDFRWLYRMLKERPKYANISHRKMPTYKEHVGFCRSHPYRGWFVARLGRVRVGYVYMTHNDEVGLFLDKKHQGCGIGFTLLMLVEQSVAGNRILANVSPRNKRSQRFFEKVGYKLIQYTYEKALPS